MKTQTETPKTYNGWTNYETWRIALEFFGDFHNEYGIDDPYELGEELKDIVEEILESSVNHDTTNIALSYALSFVEGVDFQEIAEHLLEISKNE